MKNLKHGNIYHAYYVAFPSCIQAHSAIFLHQDDGQCPFIIITSSKASFKGKKTGYNFNANSHIYIIKDVTIEDRDWFQESLREGKIIRDRSECPKIESYSIF